jgi:hypothetical protein
MERLSAGFERPVFQFSSVQSNGSAKPVRGPPVILKCYTNTPIPEKGLPEMIQEELKVWQNSGGQVIDIRSAIPLIQQIKPYLPPVVSPATHTHYILQRPKIEGRPLTEYLQDHYRQDMKRVQRWIQRLHAFLRDTHQQIMTLEDVLVGKATQQFILLNQGNLHLPWKGLDPYARDCATAFCTSQDQMNRMWSQYEDMPRAEAYDAFLQELSIMDIRHEQAPMIRAEEANQWFQLDVTSMLHPEESYVPLKIIQHHLRTNRRHGLLPRVLEAEVVKGDWKSVWRWEYPVLSVTISIPGATTTPSRLAFHPGGIVVKVTQQNDPILSIVPIDVKPRFQKGMKQGIMEAFVHIGHVPYLYQSYIGEIQLSNAMFDAIPTTTTTRKGRGRRKKLN